MNSPEPDIYPDLVAPGDAQALAIATDLESLHHGSVPSLQFSPAVSRDGRAPVRFLHRWRPVAIAAAAAAVMAAVVLIPGTWGGETERVSAQEVLDRATARAAAQAGPGGSYHFSATFNSAGSKKTRTETWYLDASHVRTEHVSVANDRRSVFGVAQDGDRSWIYTVDETGTRAVSFPSTGMVADPFAAGSLADVLATYSTPGCQEAVHGGEETVIGRRAYVVTVRSTPETCAIQKVRGVGGDGSVKRIEGKIDDIKLWVDAETFLTLRVEKSDGEGSLGYEYEVTSLDVGNVGEEDISYNPPAGAEVAHVNTVSEAKSFIAPRTKGESTPEAKEPTMEVNE